MPYVPPRRSAAVLHAARLIFCRRLFMRRRVGAGGEEVYQVKASSTPNPLERAWCLVSLGVLGSIVLSRCVWPGTAAAAAAATATAHFVASA